MSVTIDMAGSEDIAACVRMGEAFVDEAGIRDVLGFDAPAFAEFARTFGGDDRALFVARDGAALTGMLGALLAPAFFSPRSVLAHEAFWWVDPGYRSAGVGRGLVRALREWAKGAGATHIWLVAHDGGTPDAAEALYASEGLRPVERAWMGVL